MGRHGNIFWILSDRPSAQQATVWRRLLTVCLRVLVLLTVFKKVCVC